MEAPEENQLQVRYAGCLLAALLLSSCGGAGKDKPAPQAGPQRLDVSARDFALKINGSAALRPGPVTITARNVGKEAHGMVLVKLNDGVSTSMLVDALTNKPAQIASLLTYMGGTTTLPKGASWKATTSFDPGNYAMLDVGASRKGRLNFTRPGEVQGFTVSGRPVAAPAQRPSADISLYDYGITMPKVIPASGQLKVENTGDDDHQLVVIPVKNTREGKAILNAFKTGKPTHTTYRPIEVLAPTSGATSSTVSYRLPKGAYIAYCAYRTARSGGRPHAGLGMVAAFAVQ
jgi:hypothetical protein